MQDEFWQQAQDLYAHLQKGEIYYRPGVEYAAGLIDSGIRTAVENSGRSMDDLDPNFDETFKIHAVAYARTLYDRVKKGEMYIEHQGALESLEFLIPSLLQHAGASLGDLDPDSKKPFRQVRAEFEKDCMAAREDSEGQMNRAGKEFDKTRARLQKQHIDLAQQELDDMRRRFRGGSGDVGRG